METKRRAAIIKITKESFPTEPFLIYLNDFRAKGKKKFFFLLQSRSTFALISLLRAFIGEIKLSFAL